MNKIEEILKEKIKKSFIDMVDRAWQDQEMKEELIKGLVISNFNITKVSEEEPIKPKKKKQPKKRGRPKKKIMTDEDIASAIVKELREPKEDTEELKEIPKEPETNQEVDSMMRNLK